MFSNSNDCLKQCEDIRVLVEGLFDHFFNAKRNSFHPEDIQWFLKFANEQQHWQTNAGDFPPKVISSEVCYYF